MAGNQTAESLQQLHATHRIAEKQIIEQLMTEAQLREGMGCRIRQRAEKLITTCRQSTDPRHGVGALMHEYGLTNDEGLLLMGLAECLLRIPDAMTCDLLIESKLNSGDWAAHLNRYSSLLVNSSTFGLMLGERAIRYWNRSGFESDTLHSLQVLCRAMGEPILRTAIKMAMQLVGDQFVMGADINIAMARAKHFEGIGYRYSYDMLGEAARTAADAQRYLNQYQCSIAQIGNSQRGGPELGAGVSVKLSALHPRFEVSQHQRVIDELVPIVLSLALQARQQDIGLTIDAEEASRLMITLEVFEAVYERFELRGWQGLGIAVQAYQKRAPAVVEWLCGLATRVGRRIPVRLVKGAYWDSEIKWSQLGGYADYPVFTRKSATDLCYQVCAKRLLDNRALFFPQFATHNGYTIATILELDDGEHFPRREGYEFQRLHGMAETLYDPVISEQELSCRIYAPVGDQTDLLAYLVRRLLENGANNSFLHSLMDAAEPVSAMLDSPFQLLRQVGADRDYRISLPAELYVHGDRGNQRAGKSLTESGRRRNASGVDLDCQRTLDNLVEGVADWWKDQQLSVVNRAGQGGGRRPCSEVTNPANRQQAVGRICHSTEADINQALSGAENAFPDWSSRPVEERSDSLRRLADNLESHRVELIGLLNKEAGKTLADGIAEVREAVDFCRYYADQAEQPGLCEPAVPGSATALGVVLAISPWNFPLAIFLGQVSAAIVCGNTVIAKPAEQTSLIAGLVCELMVKSGIPKAAVQLLLGPGEVIGKQLIPDSRVRAVMFTGSTATGRWINQRLSDRNERHPAVLIAETGGQNAMIVDSSALPEQVVSDVIGSAFLSAGQRCSALRVLYLQEEIADRVIAMLSGAMAQLTIGDPADVVNDIGPVIDDTALQRLIAHCDYLDTPEIAAELLYRCELDDGCDDGCFFAPRLYQIESIELLKQEVFGPVVHIIRYCGAKFDQVIEQVNGTGYGLTLGLHSRIESRWQQVINAAKVGNIYINRDMVGAVVGVQPFGGHGLSGTGPKAGGPLYLSRLLRWPAAVKAQTSRTSVAEVLTATQLPAFIRQEPFLAIMAAAQLRWSSQPFSIRAALIKRMADWLRGHDLGAALSANNQQRLMSALGDLLEQGSVLLAEHQIMPGPTGQRDVYSLQSRGLVLLLADASRPTDLGGSLFQLLSALLCGNAVLIVTAETQSADGGFWQQCLSLLHQHGLPESLVKLLPMADLSWLLGHQRLSAVLLTDAADRLQSVNQVLANRPGALVPLITELAARPLIARLSAEKSIAINSSAAGGNAELLCLGD